MELFTEVLQYVLILGSLFLFVFFVPVLLWIQHRNNKREAAELKKKVQDAIEKIMADGRVESPQGILCSTRTARRHDRWIDKACEKSRLLSPSLAIGGGDNQAIGYRPLIGCGWPR